MLFDRDYMNTEMYAPPPRPASVVNILVWINAIVFLLDAISGDQISMSFSLHSSRMAEPWCLVTYMFLHADFWHIFLNMWGLFLFGKPLEQYLGNRRLLLLYFISGIIGGLCWLILNWHPENALSPYLLGASGAVMGVMMAASMLFPDTRIMLILPPIPMRLRTFMFWYIIIEVLLTVSKANTGIAHLAHLGGILGGFLYMRQLAGRLPWPFSLGPRLAAFWRRRRAAAAGRRHGFYFVGGDDPDDGSLPAELDRILDKIGEHGLQSLTPRERATLERAREYLRNRG